MNNNQNKNGEMGVIGRIIGIFTSPRETFQSIDKRPTWLVPFLIVVIVTMALSYFTLDVQIHDRQAIMRTKDLSQEQLDAIQSQMEGPFKYIGVLAVPIGVIIAWSVLAAVFLFCGNTIMGGDVNFKRMFSVVSWSGLIGLVGTTIIMLLALSKGTFNGVTTSLAVLLPTPELGAHKTILYRLLSKIDIFVIWELAVWIIGVSVIFKFSTKKAATMILSLWGIWVVISILLGSILNVSIGS